jgi:hypothetical protein
MAKRKMPPGLKKHRAKMKSLKRKHPGASHKSLQKMASRELHKVSGVGSHHKKSRPAKHHKKKSVGATRVNKSHTDQVDRKKVDITIGSVPQALSYARRQLLEQIGWQEARKFGAKTKMDKRHIQKRIAELKQQYNRIK